MVREKTTEPAAGMRVYAFTVFLREAAAFRHLLRRRHMDGVTFTERSQSLLWRVFTVTAPPGALASVKAQARVAAPEDWVDRQW
jgi:hypothetical protein